MKRFAIIPALVIIIACLAAAQPAGQTTQKTIPKYTVIPVVLDDTVSSKKNKVGDKVVVHCAGTECGGFPSKTAFVGVITAAQPASGKTPGKLSAKFTKAELPDGQVVTIDAIPSTPEGGKLDQSQVAKQSKKAGRKRGSRAGGAVGALASGFGGAMAGRVVGGAVGTKRAKGLDVEIKSGSKGNIMLNQPVSIKLPVQPSGQAPPKK